MPWSWRQKAAGNGVDCKQVVMIIQSRPRPRVFGKEEKTVGAAGLWGKFLRLRKGCEAWTPKQELCGHLGSREALVGNGEWLWILTRYWGRDCAWRLTRYLDKDCACPVCCKGLGIFSFPDWAILGKTTSEVLFYLSLPRIQLQKGVF